MHFIFQDSLMNRKHLFDIEILCNIICFCDFDEFNVLFT